MKIQKDIVCDLPMAYAVSIFSSGDQEMGVAASEGKDVCVFFDLSNSDRREIVWEDAGGTMSISQIDDAGSFLAVQNFFKGFQSETACIVKALHKKEGKWEIEKYLDLPYVHRFDVWEIQNRRFLLAATLCEKKAYPDDKDKRRYMYPRGFTDAMDYEPNIPFKAFL